MFHVGLDIHSTFITISVLNETGPVVHRAQVRGIEEVLATLQGLPDRFEVCSEASCGSGHDHDLFRPLAARVLVAHPGQLRLIVRSKDKTDRTDAERLARLLYLGETPTVHVPPPEVRAWRELINCRGQLVAKRTRAKDAARALLRNAGVAPPKKPDLWTKAGLRGLRQLELPTASQQLRRDLLLEEVEALTRQVQRVEQELNHQARKAPAVALLRTIPGVGARTAESVAAFIDDPHRFRNAKAVGRSFGLVPRQDQSGRRNRLGHITRAGAPVVRPLLAEAAWQAIRRSPTVRAFDERTRREDPQRQKIALVATAHDRVRVMGAMLRHGTTWQESGAKAA
jgi:transposase